MIKTKRVYSPKETSDGTRVLVDRLWPRGLSKEAAGADEWLKDVAPSDGLRRSYAHRSEGWPEFRKEYLAELADPAKTPVTEKLTGMARKGTLTLVYAARDEERNNAVVLAEHLENGCAPTRMPAFSQRPTAATGDRDRHGR